MSALKLRLLRENAKGRLDRAASFVDTIDPSTTVELLEVRLLKIEETWLEFTKLHNDYLPYMKGTLLKDIEAEFAEYEDKYFNVHSKHVKSIRERQSGSRIESENSALDRLVTQQSTFLEKLSSSSSNNRSASVNLPPIVIPSFSGNYKDWPSFRDLFVGSVDSKSNLSATQKFHYLKSFLRDDAANLLKHIPICDSNYLEAWEKLESRYDKVHLIVKSFIQSFLSLPTVSVGNAQTLRKLTDGADEVVRGLKAVKKTDRDPWLIYLLLNKLDQDSNQAWAEHIGARDDCTIIELLEFLESRCDALEACQTVNRSSLPRGKPSTIRAHVVESSAPKCPNCNLGHLLAQCSKFVELDINSRRTFVKNNSICFNCLRAGHSSNKCRSTFRCRICKSRHHSLVHPVESNNSQTSSIPIPLNETQPSTSQGAHFPLNQPLLNNHSYKFNLRKQTLLPTVLATVEDSRGNPIVCRVLLDSGSQSSFVVESFAQRLGYPRKHARISILGLSSADVGYTKGCISFKLCSRINSSSLFVDAYVLSKLTSNLPSHSLDASLWSHITELDLADPHFNMSAPVDVLLGADKLWSILKPEQIYVSDGIPLAQNTSFGWVITGEVFDKGMSESTSLSSLHSSIDVDTLLQRFWELEEIAPAKEESFVNDPAEQHFRQTFNRSPDGKYVVCLPFKVAQPSFGKTLSLAVSRLHSMERRFRYSPQLRDLYSDFMREYLELGHMERIPSDEIDVVGGKCFYLPHHAVMKPDSSTTKLRVVFDGSVKDSNGQSLNSALLVGPPIQRDLLGVSLRFRQHRYVFAADVVKMFRQIWVDEQDTNFQRIVWRETPQDEVQHFRLRTVTYGTASAPFLSVRVLKQLANDYRDDFPNASRVVLNDVYVDDVMTGTNSIKELVALKSELVALLSMANLQLRKWSSNCWPLLAGLPADECEYSIVDSEHSLVKLLGMFWNPANDEFSYRMSKLTTSSSSSKRTLLSEVSRIFDPLGLLAPSVVLFKILFQELWTSELNLGWDDPLPSHVANRWNTYRQELSNFEQIRVPRHVFSSLDEVELHGFSDASSLAYSAVVYSRCRLAEGQFKMTIIAAKTKVAPLKPVSIPRLELCGAVLLTRLLNLITSSFTTKVFKIFAWCDSEIVLHWLSSPPRRWTTFVANRTAAILETIPRKSWHHISSDFNPADCASRGVSPSNLTAHNLWWTGPSWLSLSHDCWPKSNFNSETSEFVAIEEKQHSRQTLVASMYPDILQILETNISSWYRMQRVVAHCLRFVFNCRVKAETRRTAPIGLTDIQNARHFILKTIQQTTFSADIRSLIEHRQLPAKSRLLRYSPFVDSNGLLRVGGRIKHSNVSFDIKHPIILPIYNNICSLIITDIHNNYMHPGVSETFAIVRQRYWILGSRNVIRKVVHKCKRCFMQRKLTSQQLMGDLPPRRIQPSRPFTNTGCDYAGPLTIKLSRGRNPRLSKAYIALFICMCTKAIHLEVVSDLTTDAFLAALRRFVSRRGMCSNLYSDNGTNFQGARRCLNEMQKLVLAEAHNDVITSSLAKDNIAWHFIPPSAPHFGGLWESNVKSVKLHLRRVVGSSILTFEELYTVLAQIEAVLNSRPLCYLSDDDLNPLTPAHFLIGEPYTAVPEPTLLNTPVNRLTRWNHLQNMVQGFWKRWQTEYLTTLQTRSKWQQPTRCLKQGDIVVIKEPNLPPTKWLLGKIESVTPGPDSNVRVVTVKTSRGTFVRPISKLALLPCS